MRILLFALLPTMALAQESSLQLGKKYKQQINKDGEYYSIIYSGPVDMNKEEQECLLAQKKLLDSAFAQDDDFAETLAGSKVQLSFQRVSDSATPQKHQATVSGTTDLKISVPVVNGKCDSNKLLNSHDLRLHVDYELALEALEESKKLNFIDDDRTDGKGGLGPMVPDPEAASSTARPE